MENVKCRIEERTSKTGSKYTVLVLSLTPTYEKDVFLDKAELEIIRNIIRK